MTDAEAPSMPAVPALRVVRGDPTPEELAVITAVVAAAAGSGSPEAPRHQLRRWADPFDAHARPWQFGANGWRSAFR